MSNLTHGVPPQSYGKGGRKVVLPVKASTQLYEGGMVSQPSGACAPATAGGSTAPVIGIAEHDALGGSADGDVRVSLMTGEIFIVNAAGSNAPTDATPFGTVLYAVTDNTVGTSSLGGTLPVAGRFAGLEDDGRVRLFIDELSVGVDPDSESDDDAIPVNGTALTDTATTTVTKQGRVTRFLLAGTMSQDETVTISATDAVAGDIVRIVRTSTSAHTLAVVNGGGGAGTIATLPNSKVGFVQAYFDGTNWKYDGSTPN